MEFRVSACDPEKERSWNFFPTGNDLAQGLGECCSRSGFVRWVDVFRGEMNFAIMFASEGEKSSKRRGNTSRTSPGTIRGSGVDISRRAWSATSTRISSRRRHITQERHRLRHVASRGKTRGTFALVYVPSTRFLRLFRPIARKHG